jgi:molecular chaperone Hsp33
MKDHLVKATAEGVRIFAAVTTDLVKEGSCRHACSPLAAAALGRTMTGALLLAANLKNQEAITLKISGDGPLGSVTADASPAGIVRGYLQHPDAELPLKRRGKLDVGRGVGQGVINVTRFTGLKNPVTGSAELISGEIAEDLTNYLYVSEQTPSSVGLGVLVGTDSEVSAAGGFIVQPLPDAADEVIDRLEANIRNIQPVSTMVQAGFDAKAIIEAVMAGFTDVHFLSRTELAFKCQCSRKRVEDVLLSLKREDIQSLVEDGHAEAVCPFCGEKYQFTAGELQALLAEK